MNDTSKPKRKAISTKTRFEVFKRDGFTCQYCGATPPGVLLQVDHILAVAEGGSHTMDNFVTACQPCNAGKGARNLKVAPQTLSEKATAIQEAEAQLLGYQQILQARQARIEDELWIVAETLAPCSAEHGMRKDWLASIRAFNKRLGFHAVNEAAEIANAKYPLGNKRTFLYFCGVCWNLVRKADAELS